MPNSEHGGRKDEQNVGGKDPGTSAVSSPLVRRLKRLSGQLARRNPFKGSIVPDGVELITRESA